MPERDTPTISAALDAGIEALSRRSEDASRDGDSLKFGSDLQHEAYLRAREISDHARALRRLRSQIEKERPFLEAAMEWCRLREELSVFQEPCSHVVEFSALSAAHSKAERRMRELYRTLA